MDMQNIITNEFLEYKRGFVDGKHEIVEAFKIGKIITLNQDSVDTFTSSIWYKYGFEDGFTYFSSLIDNGTLDLERIDTKSITKSCFAERVIKVNQEEGKEIPIGTFKI